jgi:hypothetical protein
MRHERKLDFGVLGHRTVSNAQRKAIGLRLRARLHQSLAVEQQPLDPHLP